jgi:hypothetical protein
MFDNVFFGTTLYLINKISGKAKKVSNQLNTNGDFVLLDVFGLHSMNVLGFSDIVDILVHQ